MDGYIYIIECMKMSKKSLGKILYYTGQTIRDPEIRFMDHVNRINSNWMVRNNLRPRRPVYFEYLPSCSSYELDYRERQVKRWSRDKKKSFVS